MPKKKKFRQRPRGSSKKKKKAEEPPKPPKKVKPHASEIKWSDIGTFVRDTVGEATTIAIDPGDEVSGWVAYRRSPKLLSKLHVVAKGIWRNKHLRKLLLIFKEQRRDKMGVVAIEKPFASGMLASNELFDTCLEIGRFKQVWLNNKTFHEVHRKDVKLHICGSSRAKDPNVRQALIDRFGGKARALGGSKCRKCKGKGWFGPGRPECEVCGGTKWEHPPGPLLGFADHMWAALGIACLMADSQDGRIC